MVGGGSGQVQGDRGLSPQGHQYTSASGLWSGEGQCPVQGNHLASPKPYKAMHKPIHITWVAFSLESPSWALTGKKGPETLCPQTHTWVLLRGRGLWRASLPSLLLFHFEGWRLFPPQHPLFVLSLYPACTQALKPQVLGAQSSLRNSSPKLSAERCNVARRGGGDW